MSGRCPPVDDDLLVEVHVRGHARELDHPAQLQLAPPAARLRPLQRGDQGLGLLAKLLRAAPGELDLLGELGVRPGAGDVGLAQLLLDPGEGLPHRPDELLDIEPLGELALGERGLLCRRSAQAVRPAPRRRWHARPPSRRRWPRRLRGEQVAEHGADRDSGEQGEDGHASQYRRGH